MNQKYTTLFICIGVGSFLLALFLGVMRKVYRKRSQAKKKLQYERSVIIRGLMENPTIHIVPNNEDARVSAFQSNILQVQSSPPSITKEEYQKQDPYNPNFVKF